MKKKVYLAGPYQGTKTEIESNIEKVIRAAKKLRDTGFNVFSPHLNFTFCKDIEHTTKGRKLIMEMCFQFISVCDIFALMPGWSKSVGSREELVRARIQNKEIIYLTDEYF